MITTRPRMIHAFIFGAALITAWLASHPYQGIVFDAQLYVLQTLATAHVNPLTGDLFLRFGSQNNFTLFPRVGALLFGWLGVEAGAATLTFVTAALLLASGGLLARQLFGARLAWLVLALLASVPGWYGAGQVLRYDEMYYSARLPSEALSITAFALFVANRRWAAILMVVVAVALHPLMAAPTVALLALLVIDEALPKEYRLRIATALAIAGFFGLLAVASAFSPAPSDTHNAWLGILHTRSLLLFLQDWRLDDWMQVALPMSTLLTSILIKSADERLVRINYFATLLGFIGLVLAALAASGTVFDWLLLAQTWRWVWLARYLALVSLPFTLAKTWNAGPAGRATALMLGCGWVMFDYYGGALASAGLAVWALRGNFSKKGEFLVLMVAAAATALALFFLLALTFQGLQLPLDSNFGPAWVQGIVNFAGLSGPLPVVMVAVWWLVIVRGRRVATTIVGALVIAALVGIIWALDVRMTDAKYSDVRQKEFRVWRDLIPPDSEVLWHEDPVAAWVLLGRRSFLSGSQLAGLLYSEGATPEVLRRSQAMAPLASPGWWTSAAFRKDDEPRKLSLEVLAAICREPSLDFVVGSSPLGLQVAVAEWPTRGQYVYLYHCTPFRNRT